MASLLERIQQTDPNVVPLTESGIQRKVKKVNPRDKVLAKIEDTIDGLKAWQRGEPWLTRMKKKKVKNAETGKMETKDVATPYVQLFKEGSDGKFEVFLKYTNAPLEGIFGKDKKGKPIKVVGGVEKNNLLPIFEMIRDEVKSGTYDDVFQAAADEIANMLAKKKH